MPNGFQKTLIPGPHFRPGNRVPKRPPKEGLRTPLKKQLILGPKKDRKRNNARSPGEVGVPVTAFVPSTLQ